jgi:hypothetical protein
MTQGRLIRSCELSRLADNESTVKSAEWCRGTELNCRHQPFQGCALPTELPRHGLRQEERGTVTGSSDKNQAAWSFETCGSLRAGCGGEGGILPLLTDALRFELHAVALVA